MIYDKRLYINGILADIGDTVIALTLQVNDVGKLEDRRSNLTNSFDLPKTLKNDWIFDFAGEGSLSLRPHRYFTIDYYQAGELVIFNGTAILEEVTDKAYKITVYYGNYNPIVTSEAKLEDLKDYIRQDFIWKKDCFDNTDTDYFFPLVSIDGDHQTITYPLNTLDVDSSRMFLAVRNSKIAEAIGQYFNYTLTFLDGDIDNTATLCNRKNPNSLINTDALQGYSEGLGMTLHRPAILLLGELAGMSIYDNNLENNQWASNVNYVWYRTQSKGKYKFKVTWTVYDQTNIEIKQLKTGDIVVYESGGFESLTGVEYSFTFPFLDCNELEYVYFQLWAADTGDTTVDVKIELIEAELENCAIGYHYPIAEGLPDWTIKEWLKNICNIFGLTFVSDNVNRTITFRKFLDFELSPVDWSDKFIEVVSRKFTLGWGQKSWFKYKEDDKVVESNFWDDYIEVDDTTLDKEKTIIENGFTPIATEIWGAETTICRIKYGNNTKEVKPKIFKIDDISNEYEIRVGIKDENGTFISYDTHTVGTKTIYAAFFKLSTNGHDLTYNNLIADYYDKFTDIVNNAKVIEADFNLNDNDIFDFDHFKLKFIKFMAGLFYVQKVANYVPGKATRCTLIKVI